MIKELGQDKSADWDEIVQIELSVADLQMLYDCVGAVPLKYFNIRHQKDAFFTKYDANSFDSLYNQLDEILFRHKGITDDSLDVTFVELEIVEDKEE